MVWALAIEVEAQIAPRVRSKETSRIIVSLWAHALLRPSPPFLPPQWL
jgi:hypothetical protein